MTLDVGVVVYLAAFGLTRIEKAFPSGDYSVPPVDVMRVEAAREQRGHFTLIHLASGVEADVYCANADPLHHWAIRRAKQVAIEGGTVVVAPPECVILRTLEHFREGGSEKHVRDIRAMLRHVGDSLDREALREWSDRLGLAVQRRVVNPSEAPETGGDTVSS